VVCDEQERRGMFAVEFDEQFEDVRAVLGVQIAGWFVGQQNGRGVREGSRDGYALLFAARKLRRVMMPAFAKADLFEQRLSAFARFWQPGDLHRYEDVFVCRQ